VSDFLRGLRGTMLDMYQAPDKLLAAIEVFTPWIIEQTVDLARATGNPRVFIALHRGAGSFMSNEQFARFYWPSLKTLLVALVDSGLTPMPFFEGDYTSRLEFLQELPPGKIIGHFDRVDRKRAKELIGDVMCFWGNVPASLLCAGTVDDVTRDVRELIDTFAGNGGLILDGTIGIPDEARPENVFALTEAVLDFGAGS
jgi:uroporphyrinogen-III decarboxylase